MGVLIIDSFVNVVKAFLGYKNDLIQQDERNRKKISEYLLNISNCMAAAYQELVKDEIPHGRCAEMRDYGIMLPDTLGKVIGKEKAEKLSKMIIEAHEVERLAMEFENNLEAKKELPKLDEAAGSLRALATSIKAGLDY